MFILEIVGCGCKLVGSYGKIARAYLEFSGSVGFVRSKERGVMDRLSYITLFIKDFIIQIFEYLP